MSYENLNLELADCQRSVSLPSREASHPAIPAGNSAVICRATLAEARVDAKMLRFSMPVICVTTRIRAPIDYCFDLARSVEIHLRSTEKTHEMAVAGVTRGLIGLNDEVTFEATHFCIRQRLTSRITVWNRPYHFRDSMVRGVFESFDHDHFFEQDEGITTMKDRFEYKSPLGLLGRLADVLFLKRYMARFLRTRAEAIRSAAEASEMLEH